MRIPSFVAALGLTAVGLAGQAPASPPASVLLITSQSLAKAWQPFAEWKTALGKNTVMVTVEALAEGEGPESIQERIRLCVRDHIDNKGTRWVILGGDSLPGGKGLVPGGHTTVHRQERAGIPTDIVYLSPTSWDADGDGIHGEWKDDQSAITYPDGTVGLGRVPVRTAEDVAAFTKKVIEFESNYPTTPFAKNMVYTCTDSPAYAKVRNSWDGHVSKVWDGEVARFFSQETPWDGDRPGSYALSPKNLVGLFNDQKTGKLHIHGHGMLPFWVLEDHAKFTSANVGELEHAGAYPLITTVSCFTGQYDDKNDPSIVEAMIRRPGGGSVAVVAPVRTGKPHFHHRSEFRDMVMKGKLDGTTHTMTRYWEGGLGKGLTTGESLMRAKGAMESDARRSPSYHLCICEINLLGDPTLDMRAETPRTPKLKVAAAKLAIGKGSLEVKVDTSGATVCAWKEGEVYAVGVVGDDGVARLTVAPKTAGPLCVTVTGPSLNVVSTTVDVVDSSKK